MCLWSPLPFSAIEMVLKTVKKMNIIQLLYDLFTIYFSLIKITIEMLHGPHITPGLKFAPALFELNKLKEPKVKSQNLSFTFDLFQSGISQS